jgi:hypothetical protein
MAGRPPGVGGRPLRRRREMRSVDGRQRLRGTAALQGPSNSRCRHRTLTRKQPFSRRECTEAPGLFCGPPSGRKIQMRRYIDAYRQPPAHFHRNPLETVSQRAFLQKEGEVWQNDDLKCGSSNGPITCNWTGWRPAGCRYLWNWRTKTPNPGASK